MAHRGSIRALLALHLALLCFREQVGSAPLEPRFSQGGVGAVLVPWPGARGAESARMTGKQCGQETDHGLRRWTSPRVLPLALANSVAQHPKTAVVFALVLH